MLNPSHYIYPSPLFCAQHSVWLRRLWGRSVVMIWKQEGLRSAFRIHTGSGKRVSARSAVLSFWYLSLRHCLAEQYLVTASVNGAPISASVLEDAVNAFWYKAMILAQTVPQWCFSLYHNELQARPLTLLPGFSISPLKGDRGGSRSHPYHIGTEDSLGRPDFKSFLSA